MSTRASTAAIRLTVLAVAFLVLSAVFDSPPTPRASAQSGGSGGGQSGALNLLSDTVTNVGRTASNGTTLVTLGPSLAANKKVYVSELNFVNESSTVMHTVTVQSSGGTVIREFDLSARAGTVGAGGSYVLANHGSSRSVVGEALQFKIDGAGSAGDVIVTGEVIQK